MSIPDTIQRHCRPRQCGSILAMTLITAILLAALWVPAPTVAADPREPESSPARQVTAPRLVARATLSADYLAPGPPSGALATPANGRTGPFDGQVIPGFSAAVANRERHLLGDARQRLRHQGELHRLPAPDLPGPAALGARHGGPAASRSSATSPCPTPTTRSTSRSCTRPAGTRLLTGGDFDIESLQRMPDGTLLDRRGVRPVPAARRPHAAGCCPRPVPFPLGKSPQQPELGERHGERPAPAAGSRPWPCPRNGRYLYPILEKALVDDRDPRRRVISEFDTRHGRYTGRTWNYRVDTDANLVADAQMLGGANAARPRARRLRR